MGDMRPNIRIVILLALFIGIGSACAQNDMFQPPLPRASERITKKPFGIHITRQNSPVQPERFSGYHTGADFEVLPGEQSKPLIVRAICTGPLLVKRWASGYGGVLVQRSQYKGQIITVIYGHMKLSSVSARVGQTLSAGQPIGQLGAHKSSETNGERRHLHLGIHKGTSVNLRGYAPSKTQLNSWMDPMKILSPK